MICGIFILSLILSLDFVILSSNHSLVTTFKDFKEMRANSLYNVNIQNLNSRFVNETQDKIRSPPLPSFKINRKWQIERVTNKQYEIINMLWQKTKIFVDLDYQSNVTCRTTTIKITPKSQDHPTFKLQTFKQEASTFSVIHSKLQISTPSYIEFDYLDQTEERLHHKPSSDFTLSEIKNDSKTFAYQSKSKKSSLYYRYHHLTGNTDNYQTRHSKSNKTYLQNIHVIKNMKSTTIGRTFKKVEHFNVFHNFPDKLLIKANKNETVTSNNKLSLHLYPNKLETVKMFQNKSLLEPVLTSDSNDRIKFFEMYDSNTPKWQKNIQHTLSNAIDTTHNKQLINREDNKTLLEHVNNDTGHDHANNKTRFIKKHVHSLTGKEINAKYTLRNFTYLSGFNDDLKIPPKTTQTMLIQRHSKESKLAAWSEFPFVAVYVYEPSQVHCDAASISPHWLLAAASCLSGHHKELHGDIFSAFVIFCSENWKRPSMITYVKRTLIHPQYHPRDRVRRHLFNAGVIQVVNSMSNTCNGWAPVSLMSHHFDADPAGSVAMAVGWGLDRYDKRYGTMPKHYLQKYETLVYSESCPGNYDYSKARNDGEEGIKNVYCISLPPFDAEENDTVHGALLLIGGKLLALYLQEERRPWGLQSAQYVGVWRIVPWLTDVAREPTDLDVLQFAI